MDKKEIICDAAIKVIALEGYDNMKIQMVSKEANVAVGTIYNYFHCKDEILEFIIIREYKKRLIFLDEIERGNLPPLEKINAFLHFHLNALIEDPNIGRIIVQEIALANFQPIINAKAVISELQVRLCKIIVEAQEIGTVRLSNPKRLTDTLLNTVKGFMCSFFDENNIEKYPELKNEIINFLINGIKA